MVGYRLLNYDWDCMVELRRRPPHSVALHGRPGLLPFFCALSFFAVFILAARDARAQLHWDASAQLGVMKRFLADRPPGTEDVGFGPTGQLTGHVALFPLVRVGGYVGHDLSPLPGDGAARHVTFGGLRAKGMLPWVRRSMRAWVFAGFGYTGVYSPSYDTTFTVDGTGGGRPGRVQGAGGGFFDVPLGIGASYKLFEPWELVVELGARFGFGHTGAVYDPGPHVRVADLPSHVRAPAGLDRFALGLTVGIMIDL